MEKLNLYLLGYPRIEVADEAASAELKRRQKACAIVYYLAITKQTYSRPQLAELFWANLTTAQSLTYLRGRSGLLTLNKLLKPHLHLTRKTVAFNYDTPFWCDVLEFEQLLSNPKATIDQLEQAIALYQGDFLLGLELGGISAEFDDWVGAERERLAQLMQAALDRAITYYTTWQQYAQALHYAHQLLAMDPWRESTQRQLMRLYTYHGQRNAALSQYATCHAILEKELGDAPEAETTQLFEQIRDHKLAQPLAIPFLPPAQVAHFVGRTQLLDQLTKTVEQQHSNKIIALVGMGGIGKTTTAIHLAHQLRRNYEDGVLWANTMQSDSAEILTHWALVYDVDLKHLSSLEARQTAWRGITENKRILLVLDNVESAEEVRPILPNSPHCTILITTRNHDVAHALNAHLIDLPTLEQQAAYGLLENIIGEARVSAEATAASTICEQLEYLPLALEIVAQRLHSRPRYTLSTFAQQLAETVSRLDPLTMGDRAVRASFDLSWQMLSEELQHLFAGLAVFEGRSFSSEAMAYILEMGEPQMVEGLEDLLALSLLGSAEGERYRQHALLADFSAEKATNDDQYQTNLATRLTDYFYQFTHTHAKDILLLQPNWANIQTAIDICQRTKNWQQLIDFTTIMTPAWQAQGRYTEAREAYKMAYAAALTLEQDEAIATILFNWGRAAFEQNDFQEAKQYIEKGIPIFEEQLSNKQSATKGRYWLARIAFEQSEYTHAEDLLQHCLEIFKTTKDNKGIAEVLKLQAQIALNNREVEKSHSLYSDALKTLGDIDDPYGRVNTMRKLADVKVIIGDINNAENLLNAALEQCQEIHDISQIGAIYSSLAFVLQRKQNWVLAEERALKSLELFKQVGDFKAHAFVYYRLGQIQHEQGKSEKALPFLKHSCTILQKFEDYSNLANTIAMIGEVFQSLSKFEQATEQYEKALKLAKHLNQVNLIQFLNQRINVARISNSNHI